MDLLIRAKALAERVEAEATKAKVPVAVCIIDVHGNLVLQHRMNGAPLHGRAGCRHRRGGGQLGRPASAALLAPRLVG